MFFSKLLSLREYSADSLYGAEGLIRTYQVDRIARHQDGSSLPLWWNDPLSEWIRIAATNEGSSRITAKRLATNSVAAAKAVEIEQLPAS